MKNVSNLNPLNLRPTIVLDHEGMEAIKHIVSIAPQEAQWFNTVEAVEYKNSPGEIFLYLSTKLYIPKQNTSAAQVDSSASMMMEFYNELKDQHTLEETNEILSSMTCWSHSHHNMSPHPSLQDDTQFNQLIQMSIDQNLKKWQIMLIFNKNDQFYSRVYDPNTGLILEGVDMIVHNDYNFDYIDKAAKTKFLKPKPKKVTKNVKNNNFWKTNKGYTSTDWLFNDSQDSLVYNNKKESASDKDLYYLPIAQDILHEFKTKNIKFTAKNIDKFTTELMENLTNKECFLFLSMFMGDHDSLIKNWDLPDFFFDDLIDIEKDFAIFINNKTRTKTSILNKLVFFLELLDLPLENVKIKLKEVA